MKRCRVFYTCLHLLSRGEAPWDYSEITSVSRRQNAIITTFMRRILFMTSCFWLVSNNSRGGSCNTCFTHTFYCSFMSAVSTIWSCVILTHFLQFILHYKDCKPSFYFYNIRIKSQLKKKCQALARVRSSNEPIFMQIYMTVHNIFFHPIL